MFPTHHTAARLPIQQGRTDVGRFCAHPWVADRGALAVGGVCPADRNRIGVGVSRGDPAPR